MYATAMPSQNAHGARAHRSRPLMPRAIADGSIIERSAACACGGGCPRCNEVGPFAANDAGCASGPDVAAVDIAPEPLEASPAANQVGKVEINVQPVSVANDDGSSPTTIPSLATAQAIWGKCCVTLKVASAK